MRGDDIPAASALTRNSNGLDEFVASIEKRSGLSILDLSGASQRNLDFLTALGHRPYFDDILRAIDDAFGQGDFAANQSDPAKMSYFLEQTLDFAEHTFDGALLWDTLQFLVPPLLQLTVDRLYRVLRPNAMVLAFFHADEKVKSIPLCSYRIAGRKTLSLSPLPRTRAAQFCNNRSLEKLFQNFQSVKFFLTRDHLREVLVRR